MFSLKVFYQNLFFLVCSILVFRKNELNDFFITVFLNYFYTLDYLSQMVFLCPLFFGLTIVLFLIFYFFNIVSSIRNYMDVFGFILFFLLCLEIYAWCSYHRFQFYVLSIPGCSMDCYPHLAVFVILLTLLTLTDEDFPEMEFLPEDTEYADEAEVALKQWKADILAFLEKIKNSRAVKIFLNFFTLK